MSAPGNYFDVKLYEEGSRVVADARGNLNPYLVLVQLEMVRDEIKKQLALGGIQPGVGGKQAPFVVRKIG